MLCMERDVCIVRARRVGAVSAHPENRPLLPKMGGQLKYGVDHGLAEVGGPFG